MRLCVAAVCAAVVVGTGCHVGYKSAAGGAQSPDGFGKGVTRTLQFADEGLVLSRLPLYALGMAAAVGSIENHAIVQDSQGNYWQTATVNVKSAKNAQEILDLANEGKLSDRSGGMAARLQIAAESLGGDTSGWQYDMGFAFRKMRSAGPLFVMLRGYVGLGYGNFSYNDRAMSRVDRGPVLFGDADYGFGGVYGRFGAFLAKPPSSFKKIWGLETFATVSGNIRGPSTIGIGERLQLLLLFVEVEAQVAGGSDDDRTYSIEVGLGF